MTEAYALQVQRKKQTSDGEAGAPQNVGDDDGQFGVLWREKTCHGGSAG